MLIELREDKVIIELKENEVLRFKTCFYLEKEKIKYLSINLD